MRSSAFRPFGDLKAIYELAVIYIVALVGLCDFGTGCSRGRIRHHGNTMAIAQVEMLGWLIPDGEQKIDLQSTIQRLKAAGEVIENLRD
jgi:hypothetical protein